MTNIRIIPWAHHQTVRAGTHDTRSWIEKRNMYIPTKYVQFENFKKVRIAKSLKLQGHY